VISVAEVRLWGITIGAVQWDAQRQLGFFEYAKPFLRSGIQLSPLHMPLGAGVFSFPALNKESYKGLPGMLADSLPDKFGNLLIDQWLVSLNREPGSFNPVERLLYMGIRGMGALEYLPETPRTRIPDQQLEMTKLVDLANRALAQKDSLAAKFGYSANDSMADTQALQQIISVGTSAGGARAKAVIAWNEATHEVRSGQLDCPEGFEHYLLKFDGVQGNRDKELNDPQGFTRIEYAYSQMAKAAGIDMMPCQLLEENGRAHFLTKRFDRIGGKDKLHMQTLCGVAHFDFNMAGAYSYEQAFRVMRQMGLQDLHLALEQQFRRMVFNVMARNQDDHTKNIAFLMNKRGEWRLSPAYDVTYSYNPSGEWTSSHQMSVNGKRDGFVLDDLLACGAMADVSERRVRAIVGEVAEVLKTWSQYADDAGIEASWATKIGASFRKI
jgi:serine/threonine-protein kinase HipA